MRVSHRTARILTLKDCSVELMTLERTLTELDHARLLSLLRRDARDDGSPARLRAMEDVLDDAALVPSREVAPDVVTMYSQGLLQDVQTQQRNTLTLCYPSDAEPAVGLVSVLSPVGSALLGLKVGDSIAWPGPAGRTIEVEILEVVYQPERAGELHR